MQCMQWNDVKSNANSMCRAFRKVRKVTFDKSVKSETKEPFARHKRKQPLTQEEASLQTYLNMVKINPTILEWRVAEKRRKDFGGAWAAPSHFRFMYYKNSWDSVASVSLASFLNSSHLAHGACGNGPCVYSCANHRVFPCFSHGLNTSSRHFSPYDWTLFPVVDVQQKGLGGPVPADPWDCLTRRWMCFSCFSCFVHRFSSRMSLGQVRVFWHYSMLRCTILISFGNYSIDLYRSMATNEWFGVML